MLKGFDDQMVIFIFFTDYIQLELHTRPSILFKFALGIHYQLRCTKRVCSVNIPCKGCLCVGLKRK